MQKHEIPVSAIPCLHYLRELEKEQMQAEEKEKAQVEGKETNGVCLYKNSCETNSVAFSGNEKKAENSENNANPGNFHLLSTQNILFISSQEFKDH